MDQTRTPVYPGPRLAAPLRWPAAAPSRAVDRGSMACALTVLALNLVDAFGTLRHVAHGARELNPLMDALLARGPTVFVLAKHALGSAGVLGILAYGAQPMARIAMRWVLVPVYVAIALYQAALFLLIP